MTQSNHLSPGLKKYIDEVLKVCSSRAAYVINEILANGEISSQTIREKGFVHGARAPGDVRDNGIPLVTLKTKSSDGRTIARYVFGPESEIKRHKFGGRIAFPKSLKRDLLAEQGAVCSISKKELPKSELQIDHRIPFYIAGDIDSLRDSGDFMLLSRSMQRSKSWSCESCENIKKNFDVAICETCYWAYPEDYEHIAMKRERRIDITFTESQIGIFDRLKSMSVERSTSVQEVLIDLVARLFSDDCHSR